MVTDDTESDEPDALCEDCGEPMDMTEVNVEAFEVTGRLICAECFDDLHPEDDCEEALDDAAAKLSAGSGDQPGSSGGQDAFPRRQPS